LKINPVYILTKWVRMSLRGENAAPGTGFDWMLPSFLRYSRP